MFFTPGTHKDQGLPFNPLKAIVSPRPIGWISSISASGTHNLAPYSFFNAISESPPMVAFSSSPGENGDKDSVLNIEETGNFVVNIVSKKQMEAMNQSSASLDRGVSEFNAAGLKAETSTLVAAPRVGGAPCYLECTLWKIISLPNNAQGQHCKLVIGEIVGIGIDEAIITDEGKIDVTLYQPVGRLGYMDYTSVDEVFQLNRPG